VKRLVLSILKSKKCLTDSWDRWSKWWVEYYYY